MLHAKTISSPPTARWGLLAAVLSCALATPVLAAQPDAWITTKSKLALMTTEGVRATAVNVDTINQQVFLHGTVRSAAEKAKAESVVAAIDGVLGVRNLLAVVAPSQQDAVARSDDEIKAQLNTALQARTSLQDSTITVQSVNNGVVLLAGSAKTLTDRLNAVEIASNVPGVQRVASEIQSPEVLADDRVWREQESNADYGATDASRDVWITSMAKMRLLADRETPALDINVDTRDGVVTLFGMVPAKAAKQAAEADVRKVSGVKDVRNDLQVVASAKQPAVKALDLDIQRDVEKMFKDRAGMKDIDIAVENCVARLTGTVPSQTRRLQAAVMARATTGVCSVQDDLRIVD